MMAKSALLSSSTQKTSRILAEARKDGASKPKKGKDGPVMVAPSTPTREVRIRKILNGYNVCWYDGDSYGDNIAAAKDWEEAAEIAKAYMEGAASDDASEDDSEDDE